MAWPTASSRITRSPGRAAGRIVRRSEGLRRLIAPIVTGNVRVVSRARFGPVTVLTVAGRFAGRVFYHWWVDGDYGGRSASNTFGVHSPAASVARLYIIETLDPDFDPVAGAPDMFGPRKMIRWLRAVDLAAHSYRVEQSRAGAGWVEIGSVFAAGRAAWEFALKTPRLDDLVSYAWRVIPVTFAGNDGNTLAFAAETIVRTPDAPDWTVTWDPDTERVTFAAA